MVQGAVALIDTLGMKAAARGDDIPSVIKTLVAAKRTIIDTKLEYNQATGMQRRFRVFILSDTIVVALAERNESRPGKVILDLARAVSRVQATVANADYPLAYRGAIAYGDFLAASGYVLGQAVNEAAALYEQPDGAFVVLAPSALDAYPSDIAEQPYTSLWSVPMKGGGLYETRVVHPFGEAVGHPDHAKIKERILSTFKGTDARVRMKRTATERYLENAHTRLL